MSIYFIFGIIFMILAIIITIISSFYSSESGIERVSSKISNVIQILFLAGLLLSYQSYITSSKQNILEQQSLLTEKAWVDVYQKIQDSYSKCPKFCNSLGYSWQIPSNVNTNPTDSSKDDYGAILSLSIYIFQSFSSVLSYFLYNDLIEETMNEWISSFIIWCNSDMLYQVWTANKFIYDKALQKFVDKIFNLVRDKSNNLNSSSNITKLSEQICHSSEIKEIFAELKKEPPCNP
jgi:hypothetical protein